MSREEDLRKSLKSLYDDLCDAENKQEKESTGFKHRLKIIHEHLEDLEWKINAIFGLGEFGAIGEFNSNYHKLGDAGMDQMLKTQIKLLAIEIDVNLEQDQTTTEITPQNNLVETISKHKLSKGEKIGLVSAIVAILGVLVTLFSLF